MSAKQGPLSRIVVWLLIASSWILVAARAVPMRNGDRGIFASMAERLAAGDVLYVDVWDNKEPLFYLTLALGRLVSPLADVVIELAWLAAGSLAAWAIMRAHGADRRLALLGGLGAAPLIMTGAVYSAGFSHLPGIVLVLSIYALLVTRHPLLAGVLIPVLASFKVVMLPLAIAVILVEVWQQRDRRELTRLLAGAVASTALLTVLLGLRGELRGFIDLLMSNIGYSQSPIANAYQWPIWVHVEPVMQGPAVAVLGSIVFVLALMRVAAPDAAPRLWWATCTTTVAALLVVAVTGLWPHHGQILYAPAVLALALLVAGLPNLDRVSTPAVVLILGASVVLSGAPSLRDTADSILSARARVTDLTRTANATIDLLSIAPDGGSYARLGKNTDDTHAQGLRAFTHPCHQFVQYTYDLPSTLESIPSCLPSVDYVLVDKGLVTEVGQPLWNRFVERSEEALDANFTCAERSWGRLCVNKRLAP